MHAVCWLPLDTGIINMIERWLQVKIKYLPVLIDLLDLLLASICKHVTGLRWCWFEATLGFITENGKVISPGLVSKTVNVIHCGDFLNLSHPSTSYNPATISSGPPFYQLPLLRPLEF